MAASPAAAPTSVAAAAVSGAGPVSSSGKSPVTSVWSCNKSPNKSASPPHLDCVSPLMGLRRFSSVIGDHLSFRHDEEPTPPADGPPGYGLVPYAEVSLVSEVSLVAQYRLVWESCNQSRD
ncbi:hypothetical protein H9P43_006306 [Blastocladiella emersonii ATCC 22665]|nr:hypothetical protein H9P43_006306 [Blastocladiella emersonii ATCC 22665]